MLSLAGGGRLLLVSNMPREVLVQALDLCQCRAVQLGKTVPLLLGKTVELASDADRPVYYHSLARTGPEEAAQSKHNPAAQGEFTP